MSPVIQDGAAARVRLLSVKKEPGQVGHLAAPSRESPVSELMWVPYKRLRPSLPLLYSQYLSRVLSATKHPDRGPDFCFILYFYKFVHILFNTFSFR